MNKLVTAALARLEEPSTYAGLAAIMAAVGTALAAQGPERYAALAGAVLAGLVAVAKAEGNTKVVALATAVENALPAVESVLTRTSASGSVATVKATVVQAAQATVAAEAPAVVAATVNAAAAAADAELKKII